MKADVVCMCSLYGTGALQMKNNEGERSCEDVENKILTRRKSTKGEKNKWRKKNEGKKGRKEKGKIM